MKHITQYLSKYDLNITNTRPSLWSQKNSFASLVGYSLGYVSKMLFVVMLVVSCISYAFETEFYFTDRNYTAIPKNEWSTYIWWILKSGTVANQSLTVRLIQRFYDPNFDPNITQPALYYIKFLIDVAISLVAFIALCFLIYYLYIIFFSDRDEGIANAKWYALNAFIAIILIWLSWMIVSFGFYIYEVLTDF
jgi:hypothetical protein